MIVDLGVARDASCPRRRFNPIRGWRVYSCPPRVVTPGYSHSSPSGRGAVEPHGHTMMSLVPFGDGSRGVLRVPDARNAFCVRDSDSTRRRSPALLSTSTIPRARKTACAEDAMPAPVNTMVCRARFNHRDHTDHKIRMVHGSRCTGASNTTLLIPWDSVLGPSRNRNRYRYRASTVRISIWISIPISMPGAHLETRSINSPHPTTPYRRGTKILRT